MATATTRSVSVGDVSLNVDWAIGEARRQIDQQMATASEIDGRAATFLGIIGGVTGIAGIFGDLNLDAPERWVAAVAAAILAILSACFFAFAIWPRAGASYGTDLPGAIDLADHYDSLTFRRSMARSLAAARNSNTGYLAARQLRLRIGIVLFVGAVASVALMIATGAFLPTAPTT